MAQEKEAGEIREKQAPELTRKTLCGHRKEKKSNKEEKPKILKKKSAIKRNL